MKTEIRKEFIRVRIGKTEQERINRLERKTCRKKSDLVRDALYHYIINNFPECLETEVTS